MVKLSSLEPTRDQDSCSSSEEEEKEEDSSLRNHVVIWHTRDQDSCSSSEEEEEKEEDSSQDEEDSSQEDNSEEEEKEEDSSEEEEDSSLRNYVKNTHTFVPLARYDKRQPSKCEIEKCETFRLHLKSCTKCSPCVDPYGWHGFDVSDNPEMYMEERRKHHQAKLACGLKKVNERRLLTGYNPSTAYASEKQSGSEESKVPKRKPGTRGGSGTKRGGAVTEKLIIEEQISVTKLSDVLLSYPKVVGREEIIIGTLEAHVNGFRYTANRSSFHLHFLFTDIKASFFHLADSHKTPLLHFHLHKVGKQKPEDFMFHLPVTSDSEDRVSDLKEFVLAVENKWLSNKALSHLAPIQEMTKNDIIFVSFMGSAALFVLTLFSIVVYSTSGDIYVVYQEDFEIVNFEESRYGEFDMTVVRKDFKMDSILEIKIPWESFADIKSWLCQRSVKYYVSKVENWKSLVQEIADNFQAFLECGGWDQFQLEDNVTIQYSGSSQEEEEEEEEEEDSSLSNFVFNHSKTEMHRSMPLTRYDKRQPNRWEIEKCENFRLHLKSCTRRSPCADYYWHGFDVSDNPEMYMEEKRKHRQAKLAHRFKRVNERRIYLNYNPSTASSSLEESGSEEEEETPDMVIKLGNIQLVYPYPEDVEALGSCFGTLEAHPNRFQFRTYGFGGHEHCLSIVFKNITACFFQLARDCSPCLLGTDIRPPLLHIHLDNEIKVGDKNTKDILFHLVMTTHSKKQEKHSNLELENFVGEVRRNLLIHEMQEKYAFTAPFPVGKGVYFLTHFFIVGHVVSPGKHVPSVVVVFEDDIEIVNLTESNFGIIRMTVVRTDYKVESMLEIDITPESFTAIKHWLYQGQVKYYVNRVGDWKSKVEEIAGDFQTFLARGGWEWYKLEDNATMRDYYDMESDDSRVEDWDIIV